MHPYYRKTSLSIYIKPGRELIYQLLCYICKSLFRFVLDNGYNPILNNLDFNFRFS